MKLFQPRASILPDEELLELFVSSGRSEYFGLLFDRYTPLIYGTCLKYLKNAQEAEDATMHLFESLLKKIPSQNIRTFRTWLHTVIRNHCLQILRSEKGQSYVEFNPAVMESDHISHLFDEPADQDELQQQYLAECIEQLPPKQRMAIELFFLSEKSYADIAQQQGHDIKNVKSFIQNGKRNLKICVESKIGKTSEQ